MSLTEIYTTLYDFLVAWLTDGDMRDEYDDDLHAALKDNGFEDVDADDIIACLPLVAEDLPPVYQQAVYEHLNAMSDVDSGSAFHVNQGGGEYGAVQGDGGYGGGVGGNGGSGGGESPMDEVVRHIKHIQNITENNYSYIDDSGDVTTTVTALGDVDFDQIVASGAGAIAADGDIEGVNTGTNYGVIAGDDAEDVEVTSVFGDRNVTGEFEGDATVVTGDDNVLANDSTVIDGDFDGGFINGDVAASQSALNFGDGDIGQDNSVDDSVRIRDSYNTDNSVKAKDSFNTDNSVNDSGNTTVKDSFQDNDKYVDKSDNSTHVEDNDKAIDNSDNSTNTDVDVRVKDSFTAEYTEETNAYEETNTHQETNTYTKTVNETETNVDIDESFNDNEIAID